MPRGKPFTDIQGLQDARDAGFSNAEIAELFNINAITVVRHIGPENRRNPKTLPSWQRQKRNKKPAWRIWNALDVRCRRCRRIILLENLERAAICAKSK